MRWVPFIEGLSWAAELVLQPFPHFTYVTTHSPTLPSFYLRQSSFSKPSAASPTSQFIVQPFFRFSYVTSSSLNSPGEPPMRSMQGCRPTTPDASSQGRMKWPKWMRWVWRNRRIKFVVEVNGKNTKKNLSSLRSMHDETHVEWPGRELGIPAVRGERQVAWAMESPISNIQYMNIN